MTVDPRISTVSGGVSGTRAHRNATGLAVTAARAWFERLTSEGDLRERGTALAFRNTVRSKILPPVVWSIYPEEAHRPDTKRSANPLYELSRVHTAAALGALAV